jgi:hypothetical protein
MEANVGARAARVVEAGDDANAVLETIERLDLAIGFNRLVHVELSSDAVLWCEIDDRPSGRVVGPIVRAALATPRRIHAMPTDMLALDQKRLAPERRLHSGNEFQDVHRFRENAHIADGARFQHRHVTGTADVDTSAYGEPLFRSARDDGKHVSDAPGFVPSLQPTKYRLLRPCAVMREIEHAF